MEHVVESRERIADLQQGGAHTFVWEFMEPYLGINLIVKLSYEVTYIRMSAVSCLRRTKLLTLVRLRTSEELLLRRQASPT